MFFDEGLLLGLAGILTLIRLVQICPMYLRTLLSGVLLVSLLVLSACAPDPVPKKEWVPISPEITIALESFERADRFFQEKAYSKALAIYDDYLKQSPGAQGETGQHEVAARTSSRHKCCPLIIIIAKSTV